MPWGVDEIDQVGIRLTLVVEIVFVIEGHTS